MLKNLVTNFWLFSNSGLNDRKFGEQMFWAFPKKIHSPPFERIWLFDGPWFNFHH